MITDVDIDTNICPLCGKPNGCAMAGNTGKLPEQCWCMSAEVPSALCKRIPARAKNRACICLACLQQHR